MTALRSLPTLVIAALLAAACEASPGSGAASGESMAPTPRPTLNRNPTPHPTPAAPQRTCPTLDSQYRAPEVDIQFLESIGSAQPHTVAVSRTPFELPFRPTPLDFRGEGGGMLLGGRTLPIELWTSYEDPDLRQSFRLSSLALLLAIEGRQPMPLQASVTGSHNGILELEVAGIPDINGRGTLHVRIEWSDACYGYLAEIDMQVEVDSRATVGACPVTRDEAFDHLNEVFGPRLTFGSADVPLAAAEVAFRYADTAIIDGPYPIVMLDRDARRHQAKPGETIVFRSGNPALALSVGDGTEASFHDRDAVIRHMEAGGASLGAPDAPRVGRSAIVSRADGSFSITAPHAPGHYVAGLGLSYVEACSTGTAVAGAGLDVVE